HFVVLAALTGLWLLLRGEETGKLLLFFGSGVLLGISCLVKQPGALFGLFGLGLIAANGVPDRPRRIGLFCIGGALPLSLMLLILWSANVFDSFWFWTVTYAKVHGTELGWSAGWNNLASFFHRMPLGADGLFWMMAALGLFSLARINGEKRKRLWLVCFLAFSAMALSLSNYFSYH